MGFPWYILALPILAQSVLGVTVEKGESELILNISSVGTTYTMYLEEDNHVDGSDTLLLFYLKDVPSIPTCGFVRTDKTFQFKLTNKSDTEYEFTATQTFDYETQANEYQIQCSFDSSIVVVLLNIVNVDDEAPTLTSPMCSMKENVDYDQTNTECTCTLSDPDGWLNKATFKIINSNPNAVKDLDKEDKLFNFYFNRTIADDVYSVPVYITTQRQLDYETKIFYSFSVQAKDGGNHSTTPKESVTCIIDVLDVNDRPPEWTDYFTTQQISEEASYEFNVTAVDGDKGLNSDIEYSLISFDENVCGADPCVSVVTDSGNGIITVKPIDRDIMDIARYRFEIMAQEQDDPPFTTNITITFFIEDIDDNSPLVMSLNTVNGTDMDYSNVTIKIAEFEFYENYAGTIDGQITIEDIDTDTNAQFSVELKEVDDSEVMYTDAFIIVPTAGYRSGDFQISIKNAAYLDYENSPWQNIQFYVHSYGYENITKEDELLVKIRLIDYNDEVPKFDQSAYVSTVNENIKKGQEIIQVKATDRDDEDLTLKHELVGADAIVKLLSIDEAEGLITVAVDNAFDYDRINPIVFQVEATDKANHVTIVPVTINLVDVNNKAPTYVVDEVIQVEENQMIGTELNASITASDVDTNRNLTAEIDWNKSYATKNSQRINVTDPVIRNAMEFLDLSFIETTEDTISIILTVNGNNKDNSTPDYETFDTLYLGIVITDLNTDLPEFEEKMKVDARIVINILDINDNSPVFTDDTLKKNRTVYEKSKAETIVGTIEATDADIGDIVTYSCKSINETHDWFTCSSDGVITVTNNEEIDCDTDAILTVDIECVATDGKFEKPQVFSIYIRDKNNQYPHIEVGGSSHIVEVLEKSEANIVVTNVNYTDYDRDEPFHTSVCTFQDIDTLCYEQFVVRNNVVQVRNGGEQLDRDEGPTEYDCTVYCVDNPRNDEGESQNTNYTQFTIKLIDKNDNCPELQPSKITTSENTEKGTLIGEVIAKDIDEKDNAEIDISILTVTRDNEDVTSELLFDMEKTDDYLINDTFKRWHLKANKDLRDFYGEYILQLVLSDHGTPPQSTEDEENKDLKEKSKLTVTVSKYNYYSPKFVFPDKDGASFILSSDQDPGKQLAMYLGNEKLPNIHITTGADDSCIEKWNPTFDVALTGESADLENFFVVANISKCIGQLQVDQTYNKGESSYELTLTAKLSDDTPSDTNEAAYTETIKIFMNFADPNGDPIFNETLGAWIISLPEANSTAMEELPEDRKAYYPNVKNVSVYYSLYSSNATIINTFEVEPNTGNLLLKQELDYLENDYYEFQILASRNETVVTNPNRSSLLSVNLGVEDINNHSPEWTKETFFGAIMKSSEKGRTILTALATDQDVIDQNKLKYKLNGTIQRIGSESIKNLQDPFIVEEATGAVLLNFQVEYNMEGYFYFWISVEDVKDRFGNGPFYDETTVTIYIVTADNTLTFKFENNLDDIVTNTQVITKIISDALSWECHDYSIDRDSENGVSLDNVTACNIYCVDNNTLLTSNDIKAKLNNINTFKVIKQSLLQNGVLLLNFDADTSTGENLETTLKAALIGVSVVLGALCIILAITFFLKARELNRRLKNLTEPKFGSDESNINRKGVNAPNTNMFAVEGSNPVFNDIKRDDYMEYDKRSINSINSGDSELIGVEDSPEFNGMFNVDSGKDRF